MKPSDRPTMCARCGKASATARVGFDLVEPDSGIPVCDGCKDGAWSELLTRKAFGGCRKWRAQFKGLDKK